MVLPASHGVSRAPWYSGCVRPRSRFRIQGYHFLWPRFPAVFCYLYCGLRPPVAGLDTPQPLSCNDYGLTHDRFGLFPVRSPLLRKSMFLSLPRVTKMFQFTRFASHTYGFSMGYLRFASSGFPHSDISGSKLACSSPKRFAAYRVLLRPLTPRHPPCALNHLTFKAKLLYVLLASFSLCSFQGAN
jgi:hypothetical protein